MYVLIFLWIFEQTIHGTLSGYFYIFNLWKRAWDVLARLAERELIVCWADNLLRRSGYLLPSLNLPHFLPNVLKAKACAYRISPLV